jgi:protein AbiQ
MVTRGGFRPFVIGGRTVMDKLNFFTVDADYTFYLQKAEQDKRGFSRVPNLAYNKKYKQKFLCGIVLQINDVDYYVPVTSYKQQKPDNF